ncbi:ABC multidrug transporter [Penicillium diatomitis]|uniref:ABC multidrug transporter n=1 Tax=Penicillium diatomitis TaxID=2819901 RepID=A0A9X0BU72_9EURO|nr:ABC multidrug transporter [Penicillium diatomitis]KAJ5484697.1 ABC multidrug transporter [Penicillium diatomitis]
MGPGAGFNPRDVADSVPSFSSQNAVIGSLQLLFGNITLSIALSSFGILGLFISSISKLWVRPERKVTALYGRLAITKLGDIGHALTRRYSFSAAALQLCCSISLAFSALASHVWEIGSSSFAQSFLVAWLATDIARVVLLTEERLNACNHASYLGLVSAIVALKIALLVVEELSKRSLLKSPYSKYPPDALSGIINRAFMLWLNPLMWRGIAGEPLSLLGMFDCEAEFTSDGLSATLDIVWERHVTLKSKHNLFLTLVWQFRWLFVVPPPTRFAQAAFQFLQPFLIERTLAWYQNQGNGNEPESVGTGLILAYGLVYLGVALSTAYSQYQIVRLITAIRGTLVSLIFRKSLELPKSDMSPLTLMSTEVERIVQGMQYVHEVFVSFFTLGVALWLLKRQLGVGAIAPNVVTVAFGKKIRSAQKRWVESVERRVGVTTQILMSMKSIKMSGLAKYSASLMQSLRETELVISLSMRRFLTVGVGLSFATPALAPVVGYAVYIAVASHHGDTLLASKAFQALAIFSLLSTPLGILIQTLPEVIGMVACFDRIGKFIQSEARSDSIGVIVAPPISTEKMPYNASQSDCGSSGGRSSMLLGSDLITIVDGKFWREADCEPILQAINLHIKSETVTLVAGPSGSGKKTLLDALLRELPPPSSSVQVSPGFDLHGGIAYCSQRPWLRNDTVRGNIVGNMPYDEAWYGSVLFACALDGVIQKLNQGLVGNGGATLSGGQRQRVALARAVYARRPLLLLDDPFAGLDNLSEQYCVTRLLGPMGLLKRLGTTVVLAPQTVKYQNLADQVITLRGDGRLFDFESPIIPDGDLSEKIVTSIKRPTQEDPKMMQNPFAFALESRFETTATGPRDRRKGDLGAYLYYFASLGRKRLGLSISLVLSLVFFSNFPQIWLEWWTAFNVDQPNNRLGYWIGLYALFGALAIISLILACWLMICNMVKDSAESLHLTLVHTIERAVVSVFASTDPGLMINRFAAPPCSVLFAAANILISFSQDMSLVDMELPMAFANTVITFMTCIAQIVIIAVSSRYLGATIPFVLAVFIFTQRLYIRTSRQLRFFDIEAKAPLYTEFIELLDGLSVVRAFNMQDAFQQRLAVALDTSQKPFYLLFCAQRWLGLVLNLVNLGLALILVGVTTATRGISGGFLGVALINLMNFGPSLADLVNVWSTLETSLAAVERVKYFTEETPAESTEAPVQLNSRWPQAGTIQFQDVSLRYGPEFDLAVNSLTLSIPAGTKLSVCGRSGSGKSTLCMALLRMLDPVGGAILIDGQDMSHVPHESQRAALSVVPQDPAILEGSIRTNVDPHYNHSDEEVVSVLQTVGLWEAVKEKFSADDITHAAGLSGGQKQLLCLARALVKKRRILVLDEATASVDAETDKMVHELVANNLTSTTVISVMHRLEHVAMYDLVAVLHDGELVEVGNPERLLQDPGSRLSELAFGGL